MRVLPRSRPFDSPWHLAGSALSVVVTSVLVTATCALFVIPLALGGTTLTVLSGSMEPTFDAGDVIVVTGVTPDTVCSDIGVGDIITYLASPDDPGLVTHRVVGRSVGAAADGSECRLITQGDANDSADDAVSPLQVRGRFLYAVPRLGWFRQWFREHPGTAVVAVAGVVAAYLAWDLLRPARTRVVSYVAPPEPGHGIATNNCER